MVIGVSKCFTLSSSSYGVDMESVRGLLYLMSAMKNPDDFMVKQFVQINSMQQVKINSEKMIFRQNCKSWWANMLLKDF